MYLTLVGVESSRRTVAFGGRPGPLRTPPEASQAAKLEPHGPRDLPITDIYFSPQKKFRTRPPGRLEVSLLCRHAALSLYGVGWSPQGPTPGMQSFDRVYSAVQKAVAN